MTADLDTIPPMQCDSTILIADDSPEIVKLLKLFLKPLHCDVITAIDGEEALTIAQARLPDVVLLDVMMPGKSGWEVCQALKAVQRTSHIAIVLITGKGEVKDRLTGLQVGADDYLVKPFNREEVVKRIGSLVEKKRIIAQRTPATDRRVATQDLLHDRTSGLPTIPMVMERSKEILIEQGEIGIVYIDIEQVDAIEAEYGWAFFDEFLRKAGEVIVAVAKENFRNPLTAVNRIAGSNFFILAETRGVVSAQEGIEEIARGLQERLVATLRERFPLIQSDRFGFFVGAARIQYRPEIRLERQLYCGMQIAADAVRDAEQRKRQHQVAELREIIRLKRVTTLFQPIVWAKDCSLFGYEILTRGASDSSFRNSDMLFSFARENGLAWELEELALQSSLNRLRSADLGDRKFLVNLEAEMFQNSEFFFHEMVTFFAEQKGRFVFELTERAAIEDYAVFRESLEDFRKRGIEIAIDDAGSGYASLEAIAALAPDYLKITKGLISTLPDEPIKQDLVKMLVDLSAKMGAKTLAEGIETYEEYKCCRDLGVDLIQGYYVAHPQEELQTGADEAGVRMKALAATALQEVAK